MAEAVQAPTAESGQIDWPVFTSSVAMLIALVVPLALYPEEGKVLLGDAFNFLTTEFGVIYILAGMAALAFLLYLAFGRFGSIVFSRNDAPAQFSMLAWSAMLFCGGIGTSVLFWGTIEWAHYFAAPPFGLAPGSAEALTWAVAYPLFHWGFIGWAFYCLPGIVMGYAYYVKGARTLRLSEACVDFIPPQLRSILCPIIDLIFVVGLVGACSTGIGLAVPLIGESLGYLMGFARQDVGFSLDVMVILGITAMYSGSAYLGLEKGIKRLSSLNVYLAMVLLAFVLLAGPTLFILEMGVHSIGHLLQNFVHMSTWTDPHAEADFVESWTVFYWAWWLALGPFMGLFIAKISRGRTIKEIVLGCLGYGTLGCSVFFVVLGNYAAFVQLEGVVDVVGAIEQSGAQAAVVGILDSLPWSWLVVALFTVVCVIFAATSYDSAAYTLATAATLDLPENEDPSRNHRIFWAFLVGLLPITLIYMGGLRPLQSAVTVASVPLLVIMIFATWVMWQDLRQRYGAAGD